MALCVSTKSCTFSAQVGIPKSGNSLWTDWWKIKLLISILCYLNICNTLKTDGSVKNSGIHSSGDHCCIRCILEGYSSGTNFVLI